jgi:hypothetical protein
VHDVRQLREERTCGQSLMLGQPSRMLNVSTNGLHGRLRAAYRVDIMRSVFVLIDCRGGA